VYPLKKEGSESGIQVDFCLHQPLQLQSGRDSRLWVNLPFSAQPKKRLEKKKGKKKKKEQEKERNENK
jgi:hypothetical protein